MTSMTSARRLYTCRASFLRVAPEVREAIQAGFTLAAIFAKKRARLQMSYRSFARYAREYLKEPEERHGLLPAPSAAVSDHSRSAPVETPRPQPTDGDPAIRSSGDSESASPSAERPPGQPLEITLGPMFPRLHDAANTKGLV